MPLGQLAPVLVAVLLIVLFSYALAYVSMRLQRHITATHQWTRDERSLSLAYSGLRSAAAANDGLAYDLLLRTARDTAIALQEDSWAMPAKANLQRLEHLKGVRACLPDTAGAFASQTPDAIETCRRLIAGAGSASAAGVP